MVNALNIALASLLIVIPLNWYFLISENKHGKRSTTVLLVLIFTALFYLLYGAVAAFYSLAIILALPLLTPFVYFPVATRCLRDAEMAYGKSGLRLRFDIFCGYKSIWG